MGWWGELGRTGARAASTIALLLAWSPIEAQAQPAQSGTVPHVVGVALTAYLGPGDELVAGTCGLPGASYDGDTTLELRGPHGTRVAFSDDACGLGSQLRFRVPQGQGGIYLLVGGCYERSRCGGVVAWQVTAAAPVTPDHASARLALGSPLDAALAPERAPGASDERAGLVPHVPGSAALRVPLRAGERLVAAHCGLPGAHHEGDPTLRVHGPEGEALAFDDDGCTGLGSRVVVDARREGLYTVEAGCYGSSSCSGMIGYRVEQGPPPPPWLRVVTAFRGLVSVSGAEGGGTIADGMVDVELVPSLSLRLAGMPMGMGGGRYGGVLAGSLQLSILLDTGMVTFGVGGGVSVLGSRFGGITQQEAGIFVLSGRIGRLSSFHVDAQLAMAFLEENVAVTNFSVSARIPTRDVDVVFRGSGGADGVVLGEVALVLWLLQERTHGPVLGLSVHAGAGGVFYEPLCRFGTCAEAHWYAGPVAGLGLEWRPPREGAP